jgi:SAM-dependent methyltransferase
MTTTLRASGLGLLPFRLVALLWNPSLRTVLGRLPVARRIYDGWMRHHPFDARFGVETSGSVAAEVCAPGLAQHISPYGGSQPSIVRRALHSLPETHSYAFVDVGCGKGRPLIVASELPFAHVLGVELSETLAGVGRANASLIARSHPERTPIQIQVGDATAVRPPAGKVVYFLYHPFGRGLVETFVRNLEHHLGGTLQHAFVVYYNPVHGTVMDRSPHLARWSANSWPYAPDEVGFGPDLTDTVVIWQTRPARFAPLDGAARPITVAGERAELAP